ncbi:MAG: uridylate kinase, partial [bacterium]|nr:uridylate kinase [bacterium]
MSSPLRSGAPTARTDLLRALADHLASLEHASPLRIGIDGASASGKTSLADELAVALGGRDREVIRASGDDFHHPRAIRHARGRHCAEGYYLDAFDWERLVTWLLDPLGPDADRAYRTASHDLASDARLCPPVEHASASALLLFDGMFLQRPETRGGFDVVIHLQVEPSILRTRAVTRDTA